MLRRHFVLVIAFAVLAAVVWCVWLWQPERQVRKHTETFIDAVEGKDWEHLAEVTADDYSDRWGHDKTTLISRTKEVFSQFFIIDIEVHDITVGESEGIGTATTRVTLKGTGGPLAQLAVDEAMRLKQPFVFTWRLRSGKPWDWVLTRIEQPELRIP